MKDGFFKYLYQQRVAGILWRSQSLHVENPGRRLGEHVLLWFLYVSRCALRQGWTHTPADGRENLALILFAQMGCGHVILILSSC